MTRGRIASKDPLPLRIGPLVEWWDAQEDYVQLTGSDVDQWVGRYAGLAFTQVIGTQRPDWSATGFGLGVPGIQFDATDDNLQSAISASVTNFMHDGSPCTTFYCYEDTGGSSIITWLNTQGNVGSPNIGYADQPNQASADVRLFINRGITSEPFIQRTPNTNMFITDGSANWYAVSHNSEATNTMSQYGSGGLTGTADANNLPPSSADSTSTLRIGEVSAGAANSLFSDVLIYATELSEEKCRELGAYFAATKGVAV